MDLIESFLKQEQERLDLDPELLNDSEHAKLTYFFNLFADLERKYFTKIEDIKRFDQEHKEEISQLQDTILKVKQLIEERENLNTQLKSKIKNLESELENTQYELEVCLKNQASANDISSSDTSEDLSEATIEILILEGFGKIVGAPTHEKIAVILADRHRLQEELSALKNTVPFSQELEEFNSHQTEIENLRKQVDDLTKKNQEDESSPTSSSDDFLKLENTKLAQENQNLKIEVEKLYDEIGIFESETKQLKDESKTFQAEIENLNNELDELVQYKLNYEHLKKEYDKLSTCLKQHEKLLNDKLSSPRVQTATIPQVKNEEKNLKTPKLELEWIRGENEKLLLDLEKTQTKLNDKISQYNELKSQIALKDDEMKEFIKKYEQNETTKDDILLLQKKIINLENDLDCEKEEHQKSIELGEERLKELLQRNDNLWSQLSNMDIAYKDSLNLVKQQNGSIMELETEKKKFKNQIEDLNENLNNKNETIHELNGRVSLQESAIKDLENTNGSLKENSEKERSSFEARIESLDAEIKNLNEKISDYQKEEFNFKLEIESLNKELKFIVNQNEQQNSKMMQDYLSLQEKYNKASFELEMINETSKEQNKIFCEKSDLAIKLENEKNGLNLKLDQEKMEKGQIYDRMKSLESINEKNLNKIGELNIKISKIELQNSKLEQKAKERF
ncbi:hypothetical protein BpHYR1_008891 [Brachionus plicatilis]|uniref:Uncharacterized protein n=1 Tax=Brachionus plicatilis TaxID=10195 RepID=A0A3M7T2E3_BRAPC|nr:hypothetical protein BpHYR1_008891 [Brachionus plicatilis]